MKVPYGIADFKKIREQGYVYIDKTKYIEKLEENDIVIYTRPRRFGKSLLTSMLGYYYSLAEKEEYEKLFKGLYIHENPTPNKNNYYVMQFNFSGMKINKIAKIDELESVFNNKVADNLDDFINKYDLEIKYDKKRDAAGMLSEVLKEFSGKKKENQIYIMIDEYDHFTNVMLEGKADKFLKILGDTGFVRAFYEVIKENLEKLNPPIAKFFATGVMPLTLDSLTSGFNIATKITNDEDFVAMCGLTGKEVKQAIKETGIEGKLAEETYQKMEKNYDGYIFSKYNKEHVFNTTLVMYYLRRMEQKGRPPEDLVDGNLAATGSKIENMVGLINDEQNEEILNELLLTGEVEAELTESFELGRRFDRDDFISMLYYNGYVTMKEQEEMEQKFKVPNQVIKSLYADYVVEVMKERNNYQIDISELRRAGIELGQRGNIEPLVAKIQEYMRNFSVRDKEQFNEMSIKHLFSIILALTNQFVIYNEYPAGQGFVDIYIQKSATSTVKYEAVIELKYVRENERRKINAKKVKQEAKEQLQKYMQDERLEQKENLKKYVIIFYGFDKYEIEEI